jgi:hypothetical protein
MACVIVLLYLESIAYSNPLDSEWEIEPEPGISQIITPPNFEPLGKKLPFPRLANCYLRDLIRTEDISIFGGWDLFVFSWALDSGYSDRINLASLKSSNPDMLLYRSHFSPGVSVSSSHPLNEPAEEYNWWLRDYLGNIITDNEPWSFNHLVNMTNTQAASGSHPQGVKPNQWVPKEIIKNHINKYDFWDGIFYDVYADNIAWICRDIKDANKNHIPEYDHSHNGSEPRFNDLWSSGMISLVKNTLHLEPKVLLMGNGLHTTATSYLNGRMQESYNRNHGNFSGLASIYKYLVDVTRKPAISILNGITTNGNVNPSDYLSMRFSLISAMIIGAYSSFDFGDKYHCETLWFDEYSVKRNGDVAALTTSLTQNIDYIQLDIPVESTSGFPNRGLILIDGEQIYYMSKTSNSFRAANTDFGRGYPLSTGKYDLRAPHNAGADVILYLNSFTGYLGSPKSEAYDANNPGVKLHDLFEVCMWNCDNVEGASENINSRVWRRDFENGIVLLNPSNNTKVVNGLGNQKFRKIKGIQDPVHNDGRLVNDSITIGPEDGYILMRAKNRNNLEMSITGDSYVFRGNSLCFDITIVNNSPQFRTFDLWLDISGSPVEGLDHFENISLDAGETIKFNYEIHIPQSTGPGRRTLTGYLGSDYQVSLDYIESYKYDFEIEDDG